MVANRDFGGVNIRYIRGFAFCRSWIAHVIVWKKYARARGRSGLLFSRIQVQSYRFRPSAFNLRSIDTITHRPTPAPRNTSAWAADYESVEIGPPSIPIMQLDRQHERDTCVQAQRQSSSAARERIKKEFEDQLFVLQRSVEARTHANELFQQERFADAVVAYRRILSFLPESSVHERTIIHNNLAAARLKQWRWKEAIMECEQVLHIQPQNCKALYRLAQAHRGLKEFKKAVEFVAKALAVHKTAGQPRDVNLEKLHQFLQHDLKKEKQASREKEEAELRALHRAASSRRKVTERKRREIGQLDVQRAGAAQATQNSRPLDAKTLEHVTSLPSLDESVSATLARGSAPAAVGISMSKKSNTHDLSTWWKRDLPLFLKRDDAGAQSFGRMMIYEQDGWIDVIELLEDELDLAAAIVTSAKDSKHSLYFDLRFTAVCRVAQLGVSGGCSQFEILCKCSNVDNTTEANPHQWTVDVALRSSGLQRMPSVSHMMQQYVLPRYVPHMRDEINAALHRLRLQAVAVLAKEALQAKNDEDLAYPER